MNVARAGVWLLGAVAAGLVGSGCGDPSASSLDECAVTGELLHAGALFDLVGFGDIAGVCDGSLAEAEAHALWVAEAWGEEPSPFEYRLFDSREHPCWPCDSAALACAGSDWLVSDKQVDWHELAHAVRGSPCPAILEEGIASLYGSAFFGTELMGSLSDVADSVQGRRLPGVYYPFAARFVAFLTETWGLEAVKALCTHAIVDAVSLDLALQAELGLSLDEVSAQLDAYPEWSLAELRQDRACEAGEAPVVSPGAWIFDLRCGAPRATGAPGGAMMTAQRIDLPEFGAYIFEFEPTSGSPDYAFRYELRHCDRDGMASVYFTTGWVHGKTDGSGTIGLYELPAGTYVLRVLLADGTVEPLTLSATVDRWF